MAWSLPQQVSLSVSRDVMYMLQPSSHTFLNLPIILMGIEAGINIDLTALKLIESQGRIIAVMVSALPVVMAFAVSSGRWRAAGGGSPQRMLAGGPDPPCTDPGGCKLHAGKYGRAPSHPGPGIPYQVFRAL